MFSWKDIEKYKGHWKAERLDMESWNHQPADTQVHGFGIKTVRKLKTHIQNSWLFNFFQSLLSLFISNMVTHKTLKPTPHPPIIKFHGFSCSSLVWTSQTPNHWPICCNITAFFMFFFFFLKCQKGDSRVLHHGWSRTQGGDEGLCGAGLALKIGLWPHSLCIEFFNWLVSSGYLQCNFDWLLLVYQPFSILMYIFLLHPILFFSLESSWIHMDWFMEICGKTFI